MTEQTLPRFVSLRQLETGPTEGINMTITSQNPLCTCGTYEACCCFSLGPYSSPVSPYTERPFASGLDGPPSEHIARSNLFTPSVPALDLELPYRPHGLGQQLPAHDLHMAPQGPQNNASVEKHVGMTYTPGFMGSSSLSEQMFSQGLGQITAQVDNFALQTPATTVPSIADPWNRVEPIPVADFVGNNRRGLCLECEPETYTLALKLADSINYQGFRILNTGDGSDDSDIKALQKSMSFNLPGRVPYTLDQLRRLRQTARATLGGESRQDRAAQPLELAKVLDQYGVHTSAQFQLGIVSRVSAASYRVECYRACLNNPGAPVIWLFYDATGDDLGIAGQWAAIIASNYENNSLPSYAAALATPAPAAPPRQPSPRTRSNTVNSNLLHPGYTPPSRPRSVADRNQKRTSKRNRQPKTVSSHNKPRAVDGKHHCDECDRSFLYPKDLRRHQTTHSGCKAFQCRHCTKAFTRHDNRSRHMRDDHPELTPPETEASNER